jgi:hypothetical protein
VLSAGCSQKQHDRHYRYRETALPGRAVPQTPVPGLLIKNSVNGSGDFFIDVRMDMPNENPLLPAKKMKEN